MKLKIILTLSIVISSIFSINLSMADNRDALSSALKNYCGMVRQCVMKDMDSDDMPAHIRDMANTMVEGICQSFDIKFEQTPQNTEIETQARLCIQSMIDLGCDAMESDDPTPQCKALDDMQES